MTGQYKEDQRLQNGKYGAKHYLAQCAITRERSLALSENGFFSPIQCSGMTRKMKVYFLGLRQEIPHNDGYLPPGEVEVPIRNTTQPHVPV